MRKIKRLKIILLILSFACANTICSAQNNLIDSLVLKNYQNLCYKYEETSPDSLLKYGQLQLKLANKNKSIIYQVKSYTNIGLAYTHLFAFDKALLNYLKAYDIAQKSNFVGTAGTLGHIGFVYLKLKKEKEAYDYFKRQKDAALKEKNYNSYLGSIINLANYYCDIQALDSSLNILYKGLNESRKLKMEDYESILLDNIANVLYAKGSEKHDVILLNKSKKYSDTALAFHYKTSDSSGIFYIKGLLGALNMDLGNYDDATSLYKEYINFSTRTKDVENLKAGIDEYSKLLAREKKFKEAFEYRLLFDSINKIYIGEEANRQVTEINTKYETEKKEQENFFLTEQNTLSSKTIQHQKTVSYIIILSLLASLFFLLFIYKLYKQKKKDHSIISQQKSEGDKKQIQIEHQNKMLEEKQIEILDSIRYAKRIQYALLANNELLKRNLNDYFVLFKPKDIVSGDFYWATEHDNKFYLAVCDCTGHGVPGAFMSLLNIGFLSEAIKEKNIIKPNEVFDYIKFRLINSIGDDGQRDGMDAVLICIDKVTGTISYSAANNHPIHIRENQILNLPKDKMPVGKGERLENFKLYTIDFKKGDFLYLYTDGYADQFGGPKGKKYKYKQLNELLISSSKDVMSNQKNKLNANFNDWKGDLEQVDDVLIVGLQL